MDETVGSFPEGAGGPEIAQRSRLRSMLRQNMTGRLIRPPCIVTVSRAFLLCKYNSVYFRLVLDSLRAFLSTLRSVIAYFNMLDRIFVQLLHAAVR